MKNNGLISLIVDLKAFINIKKNRLKLIEASSSNPVEAVYGANDLANQLHPDFISLNIVNKKDDNFGCFFLLENISKTPLPPFKPGQYLIVKPSMMGIEHSVSLFLVGVNDGCYILFVPFSEDEAYKKLLSFSVNDIITATSPIGYNYYHPLRDSDNIFVCADKYGYGALKAFSYDKNLSKKTKTFMNLSKDVDFSSNNTQINVFLRDAKYINGSLFIFGSESFVHAVFNEAINIGIERKKIRYENIFSKNELQDVNQKYICTVLHMGEEKKVLCYDNLPLSYSFEKAGVPMNIKCSSGTCGYCRMKLINGEIKSIFPENENPIRAADVKYNYIHPCRAYPLSDLTVSL